MLLLYETRARRVKREYADPHTGMLQAHLHSHITVFCLKQQIQCVSEDRKRKRPHYIIPLPLLFNAWRERRWEFHFTQETQNVFFVTIC